MEADTPDLPATFRPSTHRTREQTNREYDDRRGSAYSRGYNRPWAKASKGYLAKHPLCLGCDAIGRIVPAALVDHVIPHRGDRVLFWDSDNWQPCCKWHHDVVKQRLEAAYDAGRIGAAALRLDSPDARAMTGEGA